MAEGSAQFLAATGRHNYVTPSSYLELLSSFRGLLEAARADNARQRRRYTTGLEKLAGAQQQVRSSVGCVGGLRRRAPTARASGSGTRPALRNWEGPCMGALAGQYDTPGPPQAAINFICLLT